MTEQDPNINITDDLTNRWYAGQMPMTELRPEKTQKFFELLKTKGFNQRGSIEIDGFSGTYSFSAWADENGNTLYIRYGGGMATRVGLQKADPDYITALLAEDCTS